MRRIFFVVAFLVACGSKQPSPTKTGEPAGSGDHAGSADQHHAEMPSEMQAFHDLLSPRWHAPQGAQRMKDTCDAVPQFQANADAIGKATPPTTADADTWTNATRALVSAVGDLATACKGNQGAFEAAFSKVHEVFHALMAAAGGHAEAGGEHEHHAM
jgi:hypothetical protein